jgi:hypothetical protein
MEKNPAPKSKQKPSVFGEFSCDREREREIKRREANLRGISKLRLWHRVRSHGPMVLLHPLVNWVARQIL